MRAPVARLRARWVGAVAAAAACAGAVVVVLLLVGGGGGGERAASPARSVASDGDRAQLRAHPQAVEPEVGSPVVAEIDVPAEDPSSVPRDPEEALAKAPRGTAAAGPSPGAPSDAEVRAELRQLRGGPGKRATLLPGGEAVAPSGAPEVVKQIIAAGNAIAHLPYIWGGGHGRVFDRGYDCSGSLSFTFIQAGLLQAPIAQGWSTMGQSGPGRWISVYSNAGHVWMTVAGLRFDTSALHIAGSRWTDQMRSTAGFTVRHLPGL
jgi:hypothetical protein